MFHLLALIAPACPASVAQEAPTRDVQVQVSLPAAEVVPGTELEMVLDITLPDERDIASAGIPGLIVQLDVPAGVRLSGRYLTSYRDLSRNEFLMEPFERLVKDLPARIAFTLESAEAQGSTIGVNVTGYIAGEDGANASFLRQRLELPLLPNAKARPGDARDTSWSCPPELLNVGDRAPDFALPRRDGATVRLSELLGRGKNVLVTTYRAHW